MITFENVRTLEDAFVYSTEVALAQLSELAMLKKTSKSRLERQRSLCLGMLKLCASNMVNAKNVDWGHERHPNFSRVNEIRTNPAGYEVGLDVFLARFTAGASSAGVPTTSSVPLQA